MARRNRSVSMIVAATLVTVTTLLLAAVGAVNHSRRRDDEWTRLRRVTAAQTEEMATSLALPVWNIDRPQIERILDSQAAVMPIESIVVEAAGRTHARARDAQRKFIHSDGKVRTEGLLSATRPIVHDGETIGTVRLYTTPKIMEEQLRDELMRTIVTILAVDALLILMVYLVLFRAVLKPIVDIERYAGAVSTGGAIEPVEPARTAELESLRNSIESMVRLLDRRYAELQEEMAQRMLSEERFRTIFESVDDAIIIFDPESGAILDVNRAFSTLLGYTREEALRAYSGSFASNVGPYQSEVAKKYIREIGDEPLMRDWEARRKDGGTMSFEVSLRSANIGGVRRVIAVARDITQRNEMQEALRRSQTMSAMGALVAGVAHEVRNPLFSMSSMLEAYADELTTPDLKALASELHQQIARLTNLMRELLEFGRPVTVTPVPDSLAQLIDEVVNSRSRAAAEANVTLRSTVNGALPPVPMDRSRLRQVFENLVDNAMQHAPAVRNVSISAAQIADAGRTWVECKIEDDGRGFAASDLGQVFEPFFTRRERGIGLGLSIVQRIVEEHGGRVTAGNRAEGGAVITVRLPS